ncbi:unnamed protein product [Peronospora farinosa]|uniref:Uncharacterized protein n=1 Tax=Peronospora farinosa TaxID=134698 RepID=A0AAV0UL05_9STRA|nr:unnamed protein product [Peronospora farinosa]CAI5737564.1 unnamed protein product [Peronospora farinosa]
MEKLRSDKASVKSTFVEDEIGELRRYIVEMMHAEMELMESIKLNESKVAAANARIKHCKELITKERHRYKTLRQELEEDTNELRSLEEKQIAAEAKHRQFRDAVVERENEVQVLRAQFQHQRTAMLSLRCQILNATTQLETLSSMNDSVEKEAHNVSAAMDKCEELTPQRIARQKIRAKTRHIQQFIAQMEHETNQLVEKRTKTEAEVLKCEQEVHKLRELVCNKEKEADILFARLRQDTLRIIRENDKIEGKLKTKRRKFRLKSKNEISSLKRRISFVTSELEKCQMTNEDALSKIGALSTKREELEKRLREREERVAGVKRIITELSTALATVGRAEANFDTSSLQKELATKQIAATSAQQKLEAKQDLLKVLEDDHTQLNATMEDIDIHIVEAKNTATALDSEIAALMKDIEEHETRIEYLRASANGAEKKNADLQAQFQEYQRQNKSIAKMKAKLRRQKTTLIKQKEDMTLELRKIEDLSKVLAEGIKHGTEQAQHFRAAKTQGESSQKRIEFELRRQELSLQQQCAQEENDLQAEVIAWDNKIKRVEQELLSI